MITCTENCVYQINGMCDLERVASAGNIVFQTHINPFNPYKLTIKDKHNNNYCIYCIYKTEGKTIS